MGNPAGVRRDFDALERRRFEALRLLRQGLNQSEVARRLRVVRQSVARWAALERQGGERALRQAGRAGRKPRLTPRQKGRLEQRLLAGPQRLGYETSLWTSERVADLIEQEFGVRYHPGHVWKILVALGWSCQRPVGRALERNEEAIRHWKKVPWPEIKKKPKKRGERSFFSTKAD
jgi:transposase